MKPRPYGIETVGTTTLEAGLPLRTWLVESVRHVWSIERPKVRGFDWRSQFAETAQPASPWTSVNNCTERAHLSHAKLHAVPSSADGIEQACLLNPLQSFSGLISDLSMIGATPPQGPLD